MGIWTPKLGIVIGAHGFLLACGDITNSGLMFRPTSVRSEPTMGESRSVEMVVLGNHFSEEEISSLAWLIYKPTTEEEKKETEQIAEMFFKGMMEVDYDVVTILGLMSPELTTRVGKLRGQTEEEARAWADAILRENGHPSTWKIRHLDDEEEEGEEDPPGG
jgi:hypothetical protein